MNDVSLTMVFVGALITALATGLGALPLRYLAAQGAQRWLGVGHASAAGFMIAASIILVADGIDRSVIGTGIGIVSGIVFILLASHFISEDEERLFASLKGIDAKKALLVIAVMTAHSAAEGVGLGVSFGEGADFGWAITALLALHNIPEGLAIALIMVPAGVSVRTAAMWSIISSLPQPLIAVPAFAFVLVFAPALAWGLGLAGGAMIWMSFTHLVPEASEELGRTKSWGLTAVTCALSTTGLVLLGAIS